MARAQVEIRFFRSLNDFVTPALRNRKITHCLDRRASIKDVIESFNVPHPEVGQIWVNGVAMGFDYIVQDGDDIEVYPDDRSVTVYLPIRLRPELPQPPSFVIDGNLGKLARYMRLLGLDCLYCHDCDDREIAEIANEQRRIVLTRDRALLQRKLITYGYFIRSDKPKLQIREVLHRFHLFVWIKPLTRCTHCNGRLAAVDKQAIVQRLQPLTRQHYDRFLRCRDCGRIYWEGSHCVHIRLLVEEFLQRG